MLGKADQLAFYATNDPARNRIKQQLGLLEATWVRDVVEGTLVLNGKRHKSQAFLEFNYAYGIEIELLTYTMGMHFLIDEDMENETGSFFSHIGIHVDEMPESYFTAPLVQEMWTESHTNPYLIERGRKFHYKIFDTRPILGVFTKFIRRIEAKNETLG